jgi:hypothetical protein
MDKHKPLAHIIHIKGKGKSHGQKAGAFVDKWTSGQVVFKPS